MNQQTNEMIKDIDEQMSDRGQMVWLNRAHLSDDDVPDYPRDWNVGPLETHRSRLRITATTKRG